MGDDDQLQPLGDPRPGQPFLPGYGAVVNTDGVQFTLVSRHATSVSVLLFDKPRDDTPAREIVLDPAHYRIGDVWSVMVPGLRAGQLYLFRVDGPWDPANGHWFNKHRPVLDPWARATTGAYDWSAGRAHAYAGPQGRAGHMALATPATNNVLGGMPKCVVVDDHYDWRDDRPLNTPDEDTVIYEMHVGGFTKHASAGVEHPGSFRGVVEKIAHLQQLGITAVELMPVIQFDTQTAMRNPQTDQPLTNYWGYDPLTLIAPHAGYAAGSQPGAQVNEFRDMVRALHAAGIEVILDVVFNHTAEGNETGPQFCQRGIDNRLWYLLEPGDASRYTNYSGCGNTVNCNHPVVRQQLLHALHYFVLQLHVDGFRFDLASILGRGPDGELLDDPPLIHMIAEDPVLQDTKIIAEAWDAAGAYQVGGFPGRWGEWNGRFRDDIRRFWLEGTMSAGTLATRLAGSADLYHRGGRTPLESVNFVTCHDGFTLHDLVSYEQKHNLANGEQNRDGTNANHSGNHGVEGPTEDRGIRAARQKQMRNLMATLLLSQGIPMLLMGDECLRSQGGNNNAWCQDNDLTWLDWQLMEDNAAFVRFVRELISFRKTHPLFRRRGFFRGTDADGDKALDVDWFEADGTRHSWMADSRTLQMRMDGSKTETGATHDDRDALLLFNGSDVPVTFKLPPCPDKRDAWRVFLDTGKPGAHGINPAETGRIVLARETYSLTDSAMACLLSHDMR